MLKCETQVCLFSPPAGLFSAIQSQRRVLKKSLTLFRSSGFKKLCSESKLTRARWATFLASRDLHLFLTAKWKSSTAPDSLSTLSEARVPSLATADELPTRVVRSIKRLLSLKTLQLKWESETQVTCLILRTRRARSLLSSKCRSVT